MATTTDGDYVPFRPKISLFFDQDAEKCRRCEQSVYHVEKIGPLNGGAIFHRSCFRCSQCGQHLTIKTYHTSPISADTEVYCYIHVPKQKPTSITYEAVGIKNAMESQEKSRKTVATPGKGAQINMDAMQIKRAVTVPKVADIGRQKPMHMKHNLGADALNITGPMAAQAYLRENRRARYMKNEYYPDFIAKKKDAILQAQKELEQIQRKEEDLLYKEFQQERSDEQSQLKKELDEEWELKLRDLTDKFDKEMSKKKKKLNEKDKKYMTMQFQKEKESLEKTMTVKQKNKKKYMTLKILDKEQAQTSTLVQRHSKQMLELLAQKKEELERELEIELAGQEDSLPYEENKAGETHEINTETKNKLLHSNGEFVDPFMPMALDNLDLPVTPGTPPPRPPSCSKKDIYADPNEVFSELDEHVFNIAENEQQTFTDLVHQLTEICVSDLEKVRAIFRWITVKDLNMMDIEEITGDTPLGLLRGIKFGTETYHVLFMRLCSYVGLHCVEIKGHSKSVGYEPGMRIKENTFLNTWNAVFVDGDWRLIQCNWGARHLVLNKDGNQQEERRRKGGDKIRYQYDEHYFLTDPCDFILEFWPFESQWQLLDSPITLEQFESLPFVRSIFFHYKMQLESGTKAIMYNDERGGSQIKLRIPEELVRDVVFHHQLRFADEARRDWKEYKGTKMERFVFQTTVNNTIVFSIHVPTLGEYFLEIFANRIDDSNRIGSDPSTPMQPFRLKCACKFRLVSTKMTGKMHPLPNCATGEWGPWKALRHFDINPITHDTGVINEDNTIEIKLGVPRPLQFLAKVHANGVNDHLLDEFVELMASNDILTIRLSPPQPGQYGLDIFARPEGTPGENVTLAHACKFLINCSKVDDPKPLPKMEASPPSKMTKEKWGPISNFSGYGLRTVSHSEPKIKYFRKDPLIIEIGFSKPIQFAYHLLLEPDEDHREHITLQKDDKAKIARFTITLTKSGNYLFAIYAKDTQTNDKMMVNVYNYMIQSIPEDALDGVIEPRRNRRRSSSNILGIFRKDKNKDK